MRKNRRENQASAFRLQRLPRLFYDRRIRALFDVEVVYQRSQKMWLPQHEAGVATDQVAL